MEEGLPLRLLACTTLAHGLLKALHLQRGLSDGVLLSQHGVGSSQNFITVVIWFCDNNKRSAKFNIHFIFIALKLSHFPHYFPIFVCYE